MGRGARPGAGGRGGRVGHMPPAGSTVHPLLTSPSLPGRYARGGRDDCRHLPPGAYRHDEDTPPGKERDHAPLPQGRRRGDRRRIRADRAGDGAGRTPGSCRRRRRSHLRNGGVGVHQPQHLCQRRRRRHLGAGGRRAADRRLHRPAGRGTRRAGRLPGARLHRRLREHPWRAELAGRQRRQPGAQEEPDRLPAGQPRRPPAGLREDRRRHAGPQRRRWRALAGQPDPGRG